VDSIKGTRQDDKDFPTKSVGEKRVSTTTQRGGGGGDGALRAKRGDRKMNRACSCMVERRLRENTSA